MTSKDIWKVFIDHAQDAPISHLCCHYHLNGACVRSCHYADTHVSLTGDQRVVELAVWIAKRRARMSKPGEDADHKKPKLVVNREAYLDALEDIDNWQPAAVLTSPPARAHIQACPPPQVLAPTSPLAFAHTPIPASPLALGRSTSTPAVSGRVHRSAAPTAVSPASRRDHM